MDNNSFQQYREKIGTSLTLRLNDAYAQGVLSEDETPVIAQFILDRIDKVNNHQELLSFLEELSNKWPLFGPVLMIEKSQKNEENNQQSVDKIEQLIKENKIDEALNVAEKAADNEESPQEGVIN